VTSPTCFRSLALPGKAWRKGQEMGEAKRRRKLREKILEANPMCIYCGGVTPAKTVEHIPAKIVFNRKQRPKGLD